MLPEYPFHCLTSNPYYTILCSTLLYCTFLHYATLHYAIPFYHVVYYFFVFDEYYDFVFLLLGDLRCTLSSELGAAVVLDRVSCLLRIEVCFVSFVTYL